MTRPRPWSTTAALIATAALAALALVGQGVGALRLAALLPGSVPMAPSTALALLALTAVGFRGAARPGPRRALVPTAVGAGLLAWIGLRFLGGGPGATPAEVLAGHPRWPMSPITATLLSAMAGALLLRAWAPGRRGAETLAACLHLATLIVSAVLLVAYGYGDPLSYSGPVFPVALPTAACLFLLAWSSLAEDERAVFPLRLVAGDAPRAKLLRVLLPTASAALVIQGWLALRLDPGGNPALAFSIGAIGIAAVLAVALGWVTTRATHESEQVHRALHRDVSERDGLLAELRSANELNESLLATVPFPMGIVDETGRRLFSSPHLASLIGEDAIGTRCWERLRDDRTQCDRCPLRGAPSAGGVSVVEATGILGGRRFEIHHAWMTYQGRRALLEFFIDVTERLRLQQRVVISERMASLGTLAAGVAHEINNPLAAVAANVAYASEELSAPGAPDSARLEQVRAALRETAAGAERVRRIVRDLRMFSRIEEQPVSDVDVHQTLDAALSMASNEIRHRAQLVKAYGQVPLVRADESRLGQVLLNLIVNAAQAIPAGRVAENELRLATSVAPDGRVQIEVQDTGTGIAPEIKSRIFEPFFTTKAIGVGTGLGLAICHGIVSALGGEIQVESTLGVGTCFKVLLPAAEPSSKAPPLPPPAEPLRAGRILVVDDEPLVGKAVERLLGPSHQVQVLGGARDALALLASGARFDVILCDLMMPETTGMQLHEELAKASPEQAAQMVFMTGGAFSLEARAFLDEGRGRFLAKPFSSRELVEALKVHLAPLPASSSGSKATE